jgi:hypothetical protein
MPDANVASRLISGLITGFQPTICAHSRKRAPDPRPLGGAVG